MTTDSRPELGGGWFGLRRSSPRSFPVSRFPRDSRLSGRARLFAPLFPNGHLRKFLFLLAVFSVSWGISGAASGTTTFTECASKTGDLKKDCEALESLYNAAGGANWKNTTGTWNSSSDLNTWYGVTVTSDRVTKLVLSGNGLSGTIPDLSDLTAMQWLNLTANGIYLSGTIPDLSALTNLQRLYLNNNGLSGEIPDLSALTSLQYLHLYSNSISGTIPDLSALTSLQYLYLYNNSISGTIPDLSALTSLEYLHLHNNKLSGKITASHLPTGLVDLNLGENSISGTIPNLGSFTPLRRLHLDGNRLSGTITASHLPTYLRYLYLNSNSISGKIPDLSSFTNMRLLYLFENQLSGEIPDLSALTSLSYLNLNSNSLSGTITTSSLPTSLYELGLYNTSISGTIPDLSDFDSLGLLYLHRNRLSGTITASHFPTGLYYLYLNENQLSGTIPDLSDLASLWVLYLHRNSLSGTIAPAYIPKTALQDLTLSYNSLSGGIPDLNEHSALKWLYLNNNSLSGTITAAHFPTGLLHLYLSDNKLSGTIPDLSDFTVITRLAYWGNPALSFANVTLASGKDTVIDSTALRSLYSATGGADWEDSTKWLSSAPLGEWYGVTTDDTSGRVTALNLAGNGLKNEVSNSLEVLTALKSLNLSNNTVLSGTLPERLKDISGLGVLNIPCTEVEIPRTDGFIAWVRSLGRNFQAGCSSPFFLPGASEPEPEPQPEPQPEPEPEPPVSPDGSVLIAETGDGFAFTPVDGGGSVIWGTKTVGFTVTGDDGPNPTIILSRTALDAVAAAGGSVTFDISADLSGDPPSGFRLGGLVADIGLGVDDAGDTVGVCLPADAEAEGPVVHRYDEESGRWEPLAEQETAVLNGVRSVCGKTYAFPRFGLFVAGEDPVSPPAAGEGGGGCAVAGAGSGSAVPPADLLSAALLLLGAAVSRFRGTAPGPGAFASPRGIRPYSRAVTRKFQASL